MPLTISLKEGNVPQGTEVPGTLQAWLVFIRQYMSIDGFDLFNGINFGSAVPSPDDRDKPWFKTAAGGAPVGWFSWDGADWAPIPFKVPSGPTSERTANPSVGQKFFDTTISVELIFERGAWRTSSGSPGDIKFVDCESIAVALARNPGWIQDVESKGRVIGAAGDGTGLSVRAINDKVGAETVVLLEEHIPAHAHDISGLVTDRISRNNLGAVMWGNGGAGEGGAVRATDATGGDVGHQNMQPTIFRWCLVKQ